MSFQMLSQVALTCKRPGALRALERFLPRVLPEMFFQMARLIVRLRAQGAGVISFFSCYLRFFSGPKIPENMIVFNVQDQMYVLYKKRSIL